jgi:two-component system response regulator YesN
MLTANKLYDEIVSRGTDNEFFTLLLTGTVIFEIMRLYLRTNNLKANIVSEPGSSDNPAIIKKAIQYINLNYHEDINLDKIAKNLWVNPSYLSRQFKNKVGVSITEFTTAKRVFAAKNLLISTDQKVADIALSVGYGSISYFNTVFLKNTRLSPTEFRKKYKCGLQHLRTHIEE